MVKGISKQVIVVNSPDKKLFDQAIFFLSDDAMDSGGVSDAALLKEAKHLLRNPSKRNKMGMLHHLIFTSAGAAFIGFLWILSAIL